MKDKPLTKRKLLKDRQMPSPEQVNMRQNFNRISQDHLLIKKLLMKKIIGWTGGIIGIAAIVTAVVLNTGKPAVKTETPKTQSEPAAAAHVPCIFRRCPQKKNLLPNLRSRQKMAELLIIRPAAAFTFRPTHSQSTAQCRYRTASLSVTGNSMIRWIFSFPGSP